MGVVVNGGAPAYRSGRRSPKRPGRDGVEILNKQVHELHTSDAGIEADMFGRERRRYCEIICAAETQAVDLARLTASAQFALCLGTRARP
jgi:hypothetical protein